MDQPVNNASKPITSNGRTGTIFFLLVAFCVLAISLTYFALCVGKPYMGVMLSLKAGEWQIESVDANGIAVQAGIHQGDKPLEINGQEAKVFLGKYAKTGVVYGSLISSLTVTDSIGRVRKANLQEASQPLPSIIELTSWFIVCVVFWVVGFVVFFKKPRDIAARLLCLCGLALGLAFGTTQASGRAFPIAVYLEILAAATGPWLLMHFFLVLPEEKESLRKSHRLYLIYVLPLAVSILFPLIGYSDGQPILWFRLLRLSVYGTGFLGVVGVTIYNYVAAGSFRTKQQMKIVLYSALMALVPFLILNVIPSAIWRQSVLPTGYSALLIIFIPLGLGNAIASRNLFDIDVIIKRTIVYGGIALLLGIILFTCIIFLMNSLRIITIPEEITFGLLASILATTLFGPLKKGTEYLVDKFMYKDRYDYRLIIQNLNTSLNSIKGINDKVRVIVGATVNTLHLSGGCLLVKTKLKSLEIAAVMGVFDNRSLQIELIRLASSRGTKNEFPLSATVLNPGLSFLIPLKVGDKEFGVLCLSHKLSKQDFSSDDMYLIQGIATVAASSLHAADLVRDVDMRDTFVAVASHELRTPLTAIVGYTELLLDRDPPSKTRTEWLKKILDNGNKIVTLVDELLNVTRIHSGKMVLKLEPVSLSQCIEERIDIFRDRTDKHKILTFFEEGLPEAIADRSKLDQIIGNLLSNAIKYSPKGGDIFVSGRYEPLMNCIVIAVTDEGLGIDPEDRDLLFKTFQRIYRDETKGIRGSGLGLYIAKEWTEAMGGQIWVESERNKGSTFFFSLPAHNFKKALS